MTEKQLIAKCIQKDQRAMTDLFNLYANVLKASCRRMIRNEDEASDVFQEGFITIFNKLGTFESRSSLYTWMNRIMVNTALSHLRKQNIIYNSIDINEMELADNEPEMEEGLYEYLDELDSGQILELLDLLPDKYRIILGLFAVDGMKHSEIAEKLGISVALSRKMVSRARIKLVEIVKKSKDYEYKETGHAAAE